MASRRLWVWIVLGASIAGCADDNLYIMMERSEVLDGVRTAPDASCAVVIAGGSESVFEWGRAPQLPPDLSQDFFVSESIRGERFFMYARSEAELLVQRDYGEKELSSGKRDEFTVTTHGGRTYHFAYWGGTTCETTPAQGSE